MSQHVTIKTKLGAHLVEATAPDLKAAIGLVSVLSESPQSCGECASPDIAFNKRTADTYEFFALRCRACGAEFPFGQRKGTLDLFPKGPWQIPPRRSTQDHQHQSSAPEPGEDW